jgi:hypothetical protein
MRFLAFFLFNLIFRFALNASNFQKYNILKNTNVNQSLTQNWTMGLVFTVSRINCLTSCNLNETCLALVYTEDTGHCLLYTKNFQSNDLVNSNGLDFYSKNCNLSFELLKKSFLIELFFLKMLINHHQQQPPQKLKSQQHFQQQQQQQQSPQHWDQRL